MNQTRFNQFLGSIEDANPKTLSARLREMEKSGLITRTVYDEAPIRVEYQLTEKGKTPVNIGADSSIFYEILLRRRTQGWKPKTSH